MTCNLGQMEEVLLKFYKFFLFKMLIPCVVMFNYCVNCLFRCVTSRIV
jgi:hypothetical protein